MVAQTREMEFMDVRPTTRQTRIQDVLQIVVVVPASDFTTLLRAPGKDGVTTRSFFEPDANKICIDALHWAHELLYKPHYDKRMSWAIKLLVLSQHFETWEFE